MSLEKTKCFGACLRPRRSRIRPMGTGRNPPPPRLDQQGLVRTRTAFPSLDLGHAPLVPTEGRSNVMLEFTSGQSGLNLAENLRGVGCAPWALGWVILHGAVILSALHDRLTGGPGCTTSPHIPGEYPALATGQRNRESCPDKEPQRVNAGALAI